MNNSYKRLTRNMIEVIEIQVQYSDSELIREIRHYNEELFARRMKAKKVKYLELGYIAYNLIISLVMLLFIWMNDLSYDIQKAWGYALVLIYLVGILVVFCALKDNNPIHHMIWGTILILYGWNYFFLPIINLIWCRIYAGKYEELIKLPGYPDFDELKIYFISKEEAELIETAAEKVYNI